MNSPILNVSKKNFNEMFKKRTLNLDYCYYGEREDIVTHIKNLNGLCDYLILNPVDIKNYISTRLDTVVFIEGNTLKVKGLLTRPIIDQLMNEMKVTRLRGLI